MLRSKHKNHPCHLAYLSSFAKKPFSVLYPRKEGLIKDICEKASKLLPAQHVGTDTQKCKVPY